MSKAPEKTIGHALVLAARLHRLRAAQLYVGIGLFPGQENVLQLLARHGEIAMGDLADKLNVRAPTVSKTVARLTAQGLVQRSAGTGDGRIVRVALTPDGAAVAEKIGGIAETLEDELTAALDGKDRRRLRKLLRKSAMALGKASGAAIAPDEETEGDQATDDD
jgi:DNA-binding MarR family transcriptional regulator